jgi:cyclophilin family peptidyl-prolyl cis-trans isomerase
MIKSNRAAFFCGCLVLFLAAGSTGCGGPPAKFATIETDLGNIRIELLADEAPETVENFAELARTGAYNGTIFHRVISGFMIQGGDPNGDGSGGQTASGQPLPDETHPTQPLYMGGYKRGYVAMANKGEPDTAGSQFFIMHMDRPLQMIKPVYTIFGRVVEGMDVVDKIASAPTGAPNNRPINPVKMNKVTVE